MGLFGRKKKKDLVYEGVTGTATVRVATRDEYLHDEDGNDDPILTNFGIGTRKYRLELEVQLDDGRPPYTVSGRFKVPVDVGELDVGDMLPLRADPDEPQTIELDWDAWAASPKQQELRDGFDAEERAEVHAMFGDANRSMMVDGWVKAFEVGNLSREEFDEAIQGAVQSGMLTEAEGAAALARIENTRT